MKKHWVLYGFGLFMSFGILGCASVQMVSTSSQLESRGGILRYWLNEDVSENQHMRDEAYKTMHDFCGGPYRISREDSTMSDKEAAPLRHGLWNREVSNNTAYWYIHFDCLPKEPSMVEPPVKR